MAHPAYPLTPQSALPSSFAWSGYGEHIVCTWLQPGSPIAVIQGSRSSDRAGDMRQYAVGHDPLTTTRSRASAPDMSLVEHRELPGDAVSVMKPSRSVWGSRQVRSGAWTHDLPPGMGTGCLAPACSNAWSVSCKEQVETA
jgi:hypothetical protein